MTNNRERQSTSIEWPLHSKEWVRTWKMVNWRTYIIDIVSIFLNVKFLKGQGIKLKEIKLPLRNKTEIQRVQRTTVFRIKI